MNLLVVTGLSGAGKSMAVNALEDIGFFCIDNIPAGLMPRLIDFALQGENQLSRVAVVLDVRGLRTARDVDKALAALDELDLITDGGFVPGIVSGLLLSTRGWVTARSGEPELGLAQMREGRRRLLEMTAASGFAEQMTVMVVPAAVGVLRAFAERYGDLERARQAVVLLGAHKGLNGPKGGYLERVERERSAAALRELLGEEAFEAAHAVGAEMTQEQTQAALSELLD